MPAIFVNSILYISSWKLCIFDGFLLNTKCVNGNNASIVLQECAPIAFEEVKSRLSKIREDAEALKRVLLIAPQPFFLIRGTPINVRAMAETLGALGYEVDLLVYPYGEDLRMPGVKVKRCLAIPGVKSVPIGPSFRKIVLDVFLFFSALRLIYRKNYTLIHGVEEGGCMAGILAAIKRIPYIFDMDSCMPDQLRTSGFVSSGILLSIVSRIEAFFIRRSVAVLTVCEVLSEKARALTLSVPVYQIEDPPLSSANEVDWEFIQKLRHLYDKEGRLVMLYTGNFERYQGLDLLLEALARVSEIRREEGVADICLLVVGGGDDTGELFRSYQHKALALGLKDSVVFLGSRPSEEIGSFMEFSDILASPRIEGENTPMKVYTYMASGKPIVATRIRSHTQVLNDDIAYLAEPEVEAFAEIIARAAENSDSAREKNALLGFRAKELLDARYSREHFVHALSELYAFALGPVEKPVESEEKRVVAQG